MSDGQASAPPLVAPATQAAEVEGHAMHDPHITDHSLYAHHQTFSSRAADRLRVALALALAVTTIAAAREASACQPPRAIVLDRRSLPADGALDVPLNAHIAVVYGVQYLFAAQVAPAFDTLVVRTSEGHIVAGTLAVDATPGSVAVRLVPAEPLMAHTRYEVLDRVALLVSGVPMNDALAVVATFTTGDALDLDPPASPGPIEVSTGCSSCGDSACCGPYSMSSFTLSWATTPGDVLAVVSDDAGNSAWPAADYALGQISTGFDNGPDLQREGAFEVRFVDVAGNASEPVSTFVEVHCSSDADGGPEVAEGISEDVPESGPEPVSEEVVDTAEAETFVTLDCYGPESDLYGGGMSDTSNAGASGQRTDPAAGCRSGAVGWLAGLIGLFGIIARARRIL